MFTKRYPRPQLSVFTIKANLFSVTLFWKEILKAGFNEESEATLAGVTFNVFEKTDKLR